MTTFFIGCTHFGHERIIGLAKRPFSSMQNMDMHMIDRWNAKVKATDIVWHLGDFAFAKHAGYFEWLNGVKCLVIGNHDHVEALQLPWHRTEYTVVEKFNGVQFHLHHYPLAEWQGFHKKAIHLHSHTHGNLANIPGRMDVGVERMDYAPISVEEIMEHPDIKEWSAT